MVDQPLRGSYQGQPLIRGTRLGELKQEHARRPSEAGRDHSGQSPRAYLRRVTSGGLPSGDRAGREVGQKRSVLGRGGGVAERQRADGDRDGSSGGGHRFGAGEPGRKQLAGT